MALDLLKKGLCPASAPFVLARLARRTGVGVGVGVCAWAVDAVASSSSSSGSGSASSASAPRLAITGQCGEGINEFDKRGQEEEIEGLEEWEHINMGPLWTSLLSPVEPGAYSSSSSSASSTSSLPSPEDLRSTRVGSAAFNDEDDEGWEVINARDDNEYWIEHTFHSKSAEDSTKLDLRSGESETISSSDIKTNGNTKTDSRVNSNPDSDNTSFGPVLSAPPALGGASFDSISTAWSMAGSSEVFVRSRARASEGRLGMGMEMGGGSGSGDLGTARWMLCALQSLPEPKPPLTPPLTPPQEPPLLQ